MKNILNLVLWGVLSFLAVDGAYAAAPSPVSGYSISSASYSAYTKVHSTYGAACTEFAGLISGKPYVSNPAFVFTGGVEAAYVDVCYPIALNGSGSKATPGFPVTNELGCPNGGGGMERPVNGVCPDPSTSCPTDGAEFELQAPKGWDTTPNPAEGSTIAYPASVPSSLCLQSGSKTCSYQNLGPSLDGEGFLGCITSDTPGSTGLYRTTCRYKFKASGGECTPSASNDERALNPSEPPCTGYLGTVNGKTTCLPTVTPPSPYTKPAGTPATQSEAHTPSPTAGGRAPSTTNSPGTSGPAGSGSGGSDGSGKTGQDRGSGAGKNTLDDAPAGSVSGTNGLTKADLPTDYNRETTQQEIRDAVTGKGVTMADQSARVSEATEKGTTDLQNMHNDAQNGVGADKDRFFSWVWTPPVGTCAPFAGDVHGFAISWDLCDTIGNIRDVLGWLLALFTAMTVYGQLFKRYD